MISPLLITKVFGTASSLAAVAVGAAFGISSITSDNTQPATKPVILGSEGDSQNQQTAPKQTVTTPKAVVFKSTSLHADSSLHLTNPQQTATYKCKLPAANTTATFKCKIFKLDTTKKWVDLSPAKNTATQTTLNVPDLFVLTNFFKIEVEAALYADVNISTHRHLDIVDATTPTTKYATLTSVFKVDNDISEHITATYVLVTNPLSTASSIKAPADNS